MTPNRLILSPSDYNDSHIVSIFDELKYRVEVQPLNLLFLFLFICAILHTLFAHCFFNNTKEKTPFFAELEIIFGLWCIPLILAICYTYGTAAAMRYLHDQNYNEALLMVVAMSVASTYPIIHLAERILKTSAKFTYESPITWWWLIMSLGPLIGSLIKETVAMTISALLLNKYFFTANPSKKLSYGTFALLMLNVSIGGSLTNFGTSAITIAAKPWGWSTPFMFKTFGIRALIAILICNTLYFLFFRKEFFNLKKIPPTGPEKEVPFYITLLHVLMLVWITLNKDNIVVVLGSFVLFLGFYQSTSKYQSVMDLKEPLLVGFFIASVIVLGGTQIWWVEPLLSRFNEIASMKLTIFLSAFTHNTTVSYMLTKIPNLTDHLKYALFSGMMIGGGLTLIGNGANLVAYALFKKHFKYNVNLGTLFLYGLVPAIITTLIFY